MTESAVTPRIASSSTATISDWLDERRSFRNEFLRRCGWQDATLESVGEDCAWRRYFRLRQGDKTALVMEALPDRHPVATPGHNISDFVRIGLWLREQGVNTPEVFEAAPDTGYLLLEDFGDMSFKQTLLNDDAPASELYALATDVLLHMRSLRKPPPLPFYPGSHVDLGRRRVIDWYMPVVLGRQNPDGMVEEFIALWAGIEESLPEFPAGFLHIDYHVENLMWLPDRDGLARCGVLDFQGAMQGPAVYDLANLLEDPRQEIAGALRQAMIERFCAGLSPGQAEAFAAWYRVLATQFHCRVIGQFIKLALMEGKTRYLSFIPRLEFYLREGLKDPLLAPLRNWFCAQGLTFASDCQIMAPDKAVLIRPDAF